MAKLTVPKDTCSKTALAKFLSGLMQGERTIDITGWMVWPSCEHFDLFDRYRQALGEARPLWEAPIHVFSDSEGDPFISILSMVMYFSWDAEVWCLSAGIHVSIDHNDLIVLRCTQAGVVEQVQSMLGEGSAR